MHTPYSRPIQEIINNERRFFTNNYQGQSNNPDVLAITGTRPILVAAPHAVQHRRKTKIKKAEAMTGTIATQIAAKSGTHALILAKSNGEDPNHDKTSMFKTMLAQHSHKNNIKAIINMHGMNESYGYDIVLGSGLGQTVNHQAEILNVVAAGFAQSGIHNILIDDPKLFPAINPHNLSQFSWRELNTLSFQIEISYHYRNPRKHPDKYMQLIEGFDRAIEKLASVV